MSTPGFLFFLSHSDALAVSWHVLACLWGERFNSQTACCSSRPMAQLYGWDITSYPTSVFSPHIPWLYISAKSTLTFDINYHTTMVVIYELSLDVYVFECVCLYVCVCVCMCELSLNVCVCVRVLSSSIFQWGLWTLTPLSLLTVEFDSPPHSQQRTYSHTHTQTHFQLTERERETVNERKGMQQYCTVYGCCGRLEEVKLLQPRI